ncbi:MAG: hypothetical protein J07AB43_02740 [Candidatus Nanosalina sp. J07AB43]|jgi:hypothetical protein|nr:MAG: hypothetical protein J07AB43_02740 [Candidatus Nanosalina sp. J07AB43]
MDTQEFKEVMGRLRQGGNDILFTPELIRQTSSSARMDMNIQTWVYEVDAVNEIVARNRVRSYARRNNPRVKNILEPKIDSVEDTEQGTLRQYFPNTFKLSRYEVKVVVSV